MLTIRTALASDVVRISGLTITGGSGSKGAGINIRQGIVTVEGCELHHNQANSAPTARVTSDVRTDAVAHAGSSRWTDAVAAGGAV